MQRICLSLALGVAALGLSGCAEKAYAVKGKVTYNGAPLDRPGGYVVFIGPGNIQTVAAIGTDGTYRAESVPVGKNRVAVYYSNPNVQKGKKFPPKKGAGKPPPPSQNSTPYLTPPKYASAETSGFSVEVTRGAVFDADLTGPKIP